MIYDLSNVSVLLFDAKHHSRRQARIALTGMGFRSIADTHSVKTVPYRLSENRFDLLMGGIESADDGVVSLVRRIRLGKVGRDPFVPVILTTWNPSEEIVAAALNSGADDLLSWPFSTHVLEGRVHALIGWRKKFVITDTYLGPDRRQPGSRTQDYHTVEVPNALKAVVDDAANAEPTAGAIADAMLKLNDEKIRCAVRRIEAIVAVIHACHLHNRAGDAVDDVTTLLELTEQFQKSIGDTQFVHLGGLAESINRVALTIRADAARTPERELALLAKTAQALRMGVELDESVAETAHGITEEILNADVSASSA